MSNNVFVKKKERTKTIIALSREGSKLYILHVIQFIGERYIARES